MNTLTPIRRGLGITAGLDPVLARDLAVRCEDLGYHSLWSNDEPASPGLEVLGHFAAGAPQLELGVGVLPVDRYQPAQIAAEISRIGLDPAKLWIGVGSGQLRAPLDVMRRAVAELRDLLPNGTRIVLAAMRPRMCALGGGIADAVLLNWMLPAQAAEARRWVQEGAARPDVPPRSSPPTSASPSGPTRCSGSRLRKAGTATSTRHIDSTSMRWTFHSAASVSRQRPEQRRSTGSRRTTPRSTYRSHDWSQTPT